MFQEINGKIRLRVLKYYSQRIEKYNKKGFCKKIFYCLINFSLRIFFIGLLDVILANYLLGKSSLDNILPFLSVVLFVLFINFGSLIKLLMFSRLNLDKYYSTIIYPKIIELKKYKQKLEKRKERCKKILGGALTFLTLLSIILLPIIRFSLLSNSQIREDGVVYVFNKKTNLQITSIDLEQSDQQNYNLLNEDYNLLNILSNYLYDLIIIFLIFLFSSIILSICIIMFFAILNLKLIPKKLVLYEGNIYEY